MNIKSHFFLIFFSICSFSLLHAQNTCLVRINLQDCMTCLGQVSHLKDIAPNLSTTIVMEEKHEGYAAKFLEHRLQLNPQTNQYLFSDKWYNQLSDKVTSTIHVVNEKQEVLYEGELKELASLVATINDYAGEKATSLVVSKNTTTTTFSNNQQQVLAKMPESITLSNKCNIKQNTDAYYVHDYLFNEIHRQTITTNTTTTLKANEIDKEKLHQHLFGHLKHYRATIFYDEILTQLKQNNLTIETIQLAPSSLYAIIKVPYPVVEELNGDYNLIIKAQYALAEFDLVNFKLKQAFSVKAPKDSGYNIDPVSFEVTDEGFRFALFKTAWHETNYFHANYTLSDNKLIFKDYIRVEAPNFFKERNLVYEYFNNFVGQQFIFFEHGDTYINQQTGTALTLPKEIVDFSVTTDFKQFRILAVQEKENQVQLIYTKAGTYYQAILSNNKIHNNTVLNLSAMPEKSRTKYEFLDWENLIIINNNNEIVKIPIEDFSVSMNVK